MIIIKFTLVQLGNILSVARVPTQLLGKLSTFVQTHNTLKVEQADF